MFASNTSAANGAATYIEDVFSTYLYTGTNSAQNIVNGVDLATYGGMAWIKPRNWATSHMLFDTARGAGKILYSDATAAQSTDNNSLTAFNSNGFSLGVSNQGNASPYTYASWTFRKQPKFFDVVTWTGNGTNQTVNHNLGSFPGCIIYKRTDSVSDWFVSTRNSSGNWEFLKLNTTAASIASVDPTTLSVTSTSFDPLRLFGNVSGAQYVAYLFAHNAGGFGLTGTDNVISCGSFTTDGSGNATVSLGYEPQWVLVKPSSAVDNWFIFDNMRGLPVNSTGAGVAELKPNSADAEATAQHIISPTATGFAISGGGGFGVNTTCIYIAIRRGPMKTPTSGTSVFSPITSSASSGTALTTGFPVDLQINKYRISDSNYWVDRLRGVNTTTSANSQPYLVSNSTAAETTSTNLTNNWGNSGFLLPGYYSAASTVYWNFRRAPGFFDEVCYTGTGVARTVNHNLGVAPELMIVKQRSAGANKNWMVYSSSQGISMLAHINTTDQFYNPGVAVWGASSPTTSVFSVGAGFDVNDSGATYVAYLFASCPGVSKCGSYTGTGTTQQINCGFTAGSRFVLIKRTDSTGDWYVWDTARGIVSGNDPYLLLNSTAAEVTSTDYIDTYSAGFEISSTAPAAINASGGTFIYLAIA